MSAETWLQLALALTMLATGAAGWKVSGKPPPSGALIRKL